LDHNIRRQKQQALIAVLLERKIRLRAQQLFEQRGEGEGSQLQDWLKAEAEVLAGSILAPLYRKTRIRQQISNNSAGADEAECGAPDLDPPELSPRAVLSVL